MRKTQRIEITRVKCDANTRCMTQPPGNFRTRDRSESGGSALHRRVMAVLNGGGSGRDGVSHLKGVEPLGLVQSARGREAEERKPIAHGLTGQALVS
jgi:hypothetical protein